MGSKVSTAPTFVQIIEIRDDREQAYKVAWTLAGELVRKGKQNELGMRVVGRCGVFHVELHTQKGF